MSKNLQFLNSFYHKRKFNEQTKQYDDDFLEIIYRNLETNKKSIMKIKKPKMTYHVIKEEYETKHYQNYVPKENTVARTVEFSNLIYDMANISGNEQFVKDCLHNKCFKKLNQLHQLPLFYGSDSDIEDFYKGQFLDKYNAEGFYLTKGFFDIEVDTINLGGGFPREEDAQCPVNALTYFNEENKTAYVLLLRNKENPLIQEFEDNIEEIRKEIKEEFKELYGDFEYRFLFFDKEIALIKEFFRLVNDLQPDFMLA